MIFYKTAEEIRDKLEKNLEKLELELKKKLEEYEKQSPAIFDEEGSENVKISGKEFFSSRIFDPSDEYMKILKENIDQLKNKVSKFELIIRNLPKNNKEIELTLEELEEFGF